MNRKNFIKNSIYGSAAVGLALNNFSCSSHKNITILHTNDVHSHVEPFSKDHSETITHPGLSIYENHEI